MEKASFTRIRNCQQKMIRCFLILMVYILVFLGMRLSYLMTYKHEYYSDLALELHERERKIKASRGRILDRNGNVLADNKRVCTISVVHNQIKERERVIQSLSECLGIDEEIIAKKVDKYSSIERIQSNVDIEVGNQIKSLSLEGVKVDEDYKRFYPYDDLASKVLGFTGADNQGIIGLEVKYDPILSGEAGTIYTLTDAKGIELPDRIERRKEPVTGNDLYLTLDLNIQSYASQLAMFALEKNIADSVSILVMNPQNGEIYACVNEPEFNLNDPYNLNRIYTLDEENHLIKKTFQLNQNGSESDGMETDEECELDLSEFVSQKEYQDALNKMWRNGCISDTYEPGSVFKIITASASFEAGTSSLEDTFFCPGSIIVEDRRIRCHKHAGHGSQTFTEATMNSCKQEFCFLHQGLLRQKIHDF
ncbi:MAG: penicillin-binding transpeptidase domain-containing protein [Lachnospiraceae bacterium]|nr:penicillin-binding transpeptidase domain-containing protein [Lachnospiraceae bacterium]